MASVIYMDNQAPTRVDPRVVEAMLPYFTEKYGNAASRSHPYGWEAEEAVDVARRQIAAVINARAKDILFTSGATESDNLAIEGVLEFYAEKGRHVITAATEHKAVLDTCKALSKRGAAEVTCLPVDKDGFVDPDDVRKAITDKTVLISIMHVNNEIGTVAPLAEIGAIAKEHDVLFHTDATQAVGKIAVDVEAMKIDLLSMTAHKMYGPKGAGALYVRSKTPRVRLLPMMHGGGHERGMRSGTLNVPGIVGLGKACELAAEEMRPEAVRLTALRQRLRDGLLARIDDVYVNGPWEKRLPGNLHMSFAHVEGESLLMGLRDVALSSGSACTSATLEPSHVLRAIGVRDELAHNSLRFGLGRFNLPEDVDYVVDRVAEEVQRLRALSPMARAARGSQAG